MVPRTYHGKKVGGGKHHHTCLRHAETTLDTLEDAVLSSGRMVIHHVDPVITVIPSGTMGSRRCVSSTLLKPRWTLNADGRR